MPASRWPRPTRAAQERPRSPGFDAAVRPQDDLFRSANGTWLKNTTIPADKDDYGLLMELVDRSDARVRQIVDELAAQTPERAASSRRSAASTAATSTRRRSIRAGLAPLAPWFAQIDAVKDKRQLAALMGRLQHIADSPVEAYVDADAKELEGQLTIAWQERARHAGSRLLPEGAAAFHPGAPRVSCLPGGAAARQPAKATRRAGPARCTRWKHRLAQVQWSRVDLRDPVKIYNPQTLTALAKARPASTGSRSTRARTWARSIA
jgi:putative endopeptidase